MGSDTLFDVQVWTSYNATDEDNRKAQAIMGSLDQKALIQACKDTREDINIDCAIEPHWSMGTRNLVLEARFSDGIRWVLKIYMLTSDGSCLTSSVASAQTPDGSKIYETFQREYEAMEFLRLHTKLPVPTPHFLRHLPSSLGPTACLAMDLVQGVSAAFLFNQQHEKRNPNVQRGVRASQRRVLTSMAEIQITLAQFQSPVSGLLRKSPYSEHEFFMVDDYGKYSAVHGFGVGGEPRYWKPLDFYTSMIAKRARCLEIDNKLQHTTSAHKILHTIEENIASCCSNDPFFYLANVDLGARNAIFDTRGFLQAIIDVGTLRFVPIEYAAQVPAGLGLEFFPNRATSVWRADNWSPSLRLQEYENLLSEAGVSCGQPHLGAHLALELEKESPALIQGFEVVDTEDADWNDGWLGSESVLKLTGEKSVSTSSSSQCDVKSSAAGAAKHSSKQSSVTIGPNDSIHIQLSIKPCFQLSGDSKEMESVSTSSSSQCGVTSSAAGAAKHSSKQSSVNIGPNDSIHIQLSIKLCLQELPSCSWR